MYSILFMSFGTFNINGSFNQPPPLHQFQPQPQPQPQHQIDARQIYKQLGTEFCKNYYTAYDSNYQSLIYMFKPESIFTFLEEEIVGFNNVYQRVTNHYGIQKFSHDIKTIDTQPVGAKTILITVAGLVRVNEHIMASQYQPFVETFLLQKDDNTQSFFVFNNVFRLLV